MFHPGKEGELPEEHPWLVIGMYGDGADFYALKRAVLCLCARYGLKPDVQPGGQGYYHPGRKAELSIRGGSVKLGEMGEIHPVTAEKFALPERAYIAEIDVDVLRACQVELGAIKPLPRFPAVSRDIALVVDEAVGAGDLLGTIEKAAGKLCENVKLFDVYKGERLGQGKKSLAYTIMLRSPDHTLTDSEINAAMDKVLGSVQKAYGAVLRA